MEWDREKVCLLIALYREQRVLWDSTHPGFKNRNRKHDAWGTISTTLDIHRKEVESKMRKLISQFYRECKRGNSSYGTEEANRKWFGYKLLIFLKDKNIPCNSHNFIVDHQEEILQDGNSDLLEYVDEGTEDSVDQTNYACNNSTSVKPSPSRSQNTTNRYKRKYTDDMTEEDEEDYKTTVKCARQKRDEYDVFGEYVAHSLRKLKTEHAKLVVKHEISTLLFNGGMGYYDGRSHSTVSSPLIASNEESVKEAGEKNAINTLENI